MGVKCLKGYISNFLLDHKLLKLTIYTNWSIEEIIKIHILNQQDGIH